MKIIICSHNKGKIKEFKEIFKEYNINNIELLSLDNFDKIEEPIEDGNSFYDNAIIKARYYYEYLKLPVITDDSGLCVISLNNEPGIYSARYAEFDNPNNLKPMDKLLNKLENNLNREAFFECDLVYFDGINTLNSKGFVQGKISTVKKGNNGFGYDPIFIPKGYEETLAELGEDVKNSISHRRNSLNEMIELLQDYKII